MQRIGIEGDVLHATAVDAAGYLVGTPEVPLEHQPATAGDQHRMYIGSARGDPIGHPAQRIAVDELVLVDGGDGPAVISCGWNTAAAGRVRVYPQCGEWCQRSPAEK